MVFIGEVACSPKYQPLSSIHLVARECVLSARCAGMTNVLRGIADWRAGILLDIIAETAPHLDERAVKTHVQRLIAPMPHPSMVEMFGRLGLALIGVEKFDDTGTTKKGDGKPADFDAIYRRLYQVGTGCLGWTPEATLAATPLEIGLAFEGRTDMLKAIFGNKDEPKNVEQTPDMVDAMAAQAMARWGAKAA